MAERKPVRMAASANASLGERRLAIELSTRASDNISQLIHTLADSNSEYTPAAKATRNLITSGKAMLYGTVDEAVTDKRFAFGALITPDLSSKKVIPALVFNVRHLELQGDFLTWSRRAIEEVAEGVAVGVPYLFDAMRGDTYWQLIDEVEFFRILSEGDPTRQKVVAVGVGNKKNPV